MYCYIDNGVYKCFMSLITGRVVYKNKYKIYKKEDFYIPFFVYK